MCEMEQITYLEFEPAGLLHSFALADLEVDVQVLLLQETGGLLQHHNGLGGELEGLLEGLGLSGIVELLELALLGDLGEGGLQDFDIDALGSGLYLRSELLLLLGSFQDGDEGGDIGHFECEGCEVSSDQKLGVFVIVEKVGDG